MLGLTRAQVRSATHGSRSSTITPTAQACI
jgi:hypothetical protein